MCRICLPYTSDFIGKILSLCLPARMCMCVYAFVNVSFCSVKTLLSVWKECAAPWVLFWELIPTSSATALGCLIITPQWPHILSCLLCLRHVRFICTAQYCVQLSRWASQTCCEEDLTLRLTFIHHKAWCFTSLSFVREDVGRGCDVREFYRHQ